MRAVRRALILVVLCGLAAGGSALARSAVSTSIVKWNRIGDVGLNTARASVVAHYAPFSGNIAVHKTAEGGELDAVIARGRVVAVSDDSPRYSTADGIRVGIKTPSTSTWKGFTFVKDFQSWQLAICYGGIHTLVSLDTENRIIRRIGIAFAAGVCPGLTPKQPLTAADKAAIIAVARAASKPATVTVTRFKVAIDSKEWASGIISGKDPQGYPLQSAVAIFHHGAKWTLVEVGTDQVGCSKVPIKPLTQIGSECSGG
jgi:hypothetical protein